MGAKYITSLVNLNITSASPSQNTSTGWRFDSVTSARADGEQNAEHDDLQHVPLGHGLGDILRKRVQDRFRGGLRLGGHPRGFDHGGYRDADPGARQVDRREPDEQRDRGHDFEIDDRLEPHAPHLAQV